MLAITKRTEAQQGQAGISKKANITPNRNEPKESWAKRNPQYFPVDVNKASKDELLRVPGLGQITVDRILEQRKISRIQTIADLGKFTLRLKKTNEYLSF